MLRKRAMFDGFELSHAQLPEARLQSLWRALDPKRVGHIDVGTFIHFMRFGGGHAAEAAGADRTSQYKRVAQRNQQRARDAKTSSMAAETARRFAAATQMKESEAREAMEEAQRLEEELRSYGVK